jgi:saccharopine dehydrogenase (NAD+, L-lysine-forming)
LARLLLEHTEVQVTVAGRRGDRAGEYAAELNARFPGVRASAVTVDAASAGSIRDALRGVDLLVTAAPVAEHFPAILGVALEAGVDCLDLLLDTRKTEALQSAAQQIRRAGACFITEAGFHPGLPAAMVRYAASHLDQPQSALAAAYLNLGRSLPYTESVSELLALFRDYPAQVFRDGQWVGAGLRGADVRKVDFGGQIGSRRCYSLFLEELRALPGMYPTLRTLGFYVAETHWLLDWVITPLVIAGLKIAPRRGVRPLGRLLWWGMRTLPSPPHRVLLKAEAYGGRAGVPVRVGLTVSHPDGYEMTAIPVVACLLQYLDGSARRPGLWMMGHLVEPLRFFRDVERLGADVSRVTA